MSVPRALLKYPTARRCDAVDTFPHPATVADPYRWLEDPDSVETRTFVDAQNLLTQEYLGEFQHSSALRASIESAYAFEKFGAPKRKGDQYWYYSYNPGLLSQAQIWRSKTLSREEPELFFDPNGLSEDGTVALGSASFSPDGKYFAYSTTKSGSDNQVIQLKETHRIAEAPGKLNEKILYVKFSSISWTKDNAGFIYHRYPAKDSTGKGTAADVNSALYYHRLDTEQTDDILIHKDDDNPTHMFGAEISDDGHYLLITTSQGTEHTNKLHIAFLGESKQIHDSIETQVVVNDFRASFDYVTNYGEKFIFVTNENATRNKVVSIDVNKLQDGFSELIPESDDVLEQCNAVNSGHLILTYTHDVNQQVSLYDSNGSFTKRLDLPLGLAVYGTVCDHDSPLFFISVGGFTTPMTLYKYEFQSDSLSLYRQTVVTGIDPDDFGTEQVFYPSKDGTKIPMFITGRKGLSTDGTVPCLQYGYGGFEISVIPSFSILYIILMKYFGFRIAVANIRGGGEYGHAWWKAAIKKNRQVAYDDFQSASTYLLQEKYTCPEKLAIYGGSNGGLLCGVCLNQKPALYGAVMAAVGVLDMLRFHKFTIGAAWTSDFGSPDDPAMYPVIKAYSPLHNIDRSTEYPATLLLTADHDDRVVPCHTLKFIAELQYSKESNLAPLMTRVETKAGHGAGKPTSKKIDETRDQIMFLSRALGVDFERAGEVTLS